MGTVVNHQPMSGFNTKVSVAIGAVKPIGSIVILDGGAIKGATTLTVDPLTEKIESGNWLLFTDADGLEYLIKVVATAEAGATTLSVKAIATAIPDLAEASFPSELYDRAAVDFERSINTVNVVSLNTGGSELQVATTSSQSISAPGYWHWWNPGLRICEDHAESKKAFWIIIEYESPDPKIFAKGAIISGVGIITDLPKASPADGFVSSDLSFLFTGQVTITEPVPI